MAYQQGSYDYYSQSQYAATPDPSYSSQSYPSQVSYTTTSSEQDISSYQTQGYAAVTDTTTSASGDNQGYQSYPYASSYDYSNAATQEQANYTYSQSSESYGSSYDSNYSQTNTSGENLGQSASVAVAGGQDQYYYSQGQAQGDSYYTEYQTSSTTSTVTNQPPLTQSQYASYGSAPGSAAPPSNVNTASDQAYQYDYSNTNTSNNANVTTSQTQDWTGSSSQGQAAGYEQSSSYYNSTPQVPYGSTQTQATSDYTQVDQSYYNTRPTYDQNVPSGQGYVQQPQVSSGPEVPKQNQVPAQQHYGEQPRFDARPAIASYQTSSQPDWNTRTAQNTGTGSQFAGQSGQQSSRTFPPKNDHTFQNSSSQQNKPTFSSVIEHLAKLQEMSKTKSHPNDGKRQSSAGDQTQQKGPGTTPSNLRPIMPSSGQPRMHSRQQPLQRNVKPSDNRQSFSPTRGNQNVANRKGSGGLDRTIGQGRIPGSQGQFPPNQQQGRQEQNRPQYKGPHKMESKGPGSLSNSRPMSSGRSGHISKGGHNNQGQSMGGEKMSPHRSRIPGVGPRGPHFNQQGGDNWKGPRGADQKFPRGPGHMASPRGPDGMPVRGPGPRMGSPMPPRGPYPPHPKGPTDMPAPKPGSSPQKRKRSMEDDKKSDKRSQRMPDSPPPEIGRQQGPPFRPRGPHDRFFRFGMRPPGEMFGPRFRGPPPDMFFDGPRGMRPRPPFGPRHPGPWDAPPEFMHRMRGRFPFPFWEGKHDRDDHGPPSMLEPLRKRRRSSGSGDDLGPRGDPSRDAPRGPHPRHLPTDVLRGLPPMHRPDKNSVPQFTGTKAGKFGKSLTERKKMEGSDARKVVKKGTDTKFQCDVCQVGFNTKDSHTDHTKQHKNCDVEDCGFEGISRVLQLHKQQAHQPNIPSVKWSRDKEDVQSWLEDRKRNFPTAATVAAKKAVQEDKERMGAVLTTKEFGKMKRKKQDGGKLTVDGAGDKERKEGDSERQEGTVEDEQVGQEGEKTMAGEDGKVNETESKEGTDDGEKTRNKEGEKERPKGEETGSKEEAEKRLEGVVAGDVGEGKGKEKTEMSAEEKMKEDDNTVAKDEGKESASKDKEEGAKVDDAKEDDEEDHPTRALSDSKEMSPAKKREVTFQVVKREVKRLKSGKASKREPWRTNKPVQKFISTTGGSRRATLLEMLLAPEMRHERNLLLQCVRFTVRNNFFEPKKEVSTTSGTVGPERKPSAESAKEQTEKSGTDISSNSNLRDKGVGNANEGVTSDKQERRDRTAKDETDENVSQVDAKLHPEKSETAAVMDVTVKDEEDEYPVSRKDGDDESSVESAGNLVSASEAREQTHSVSKEKGVSDQKEENTICGDQSRLDADSESTSKMTDEEMDSREGGENGVAEPGKDANDSGNEKMETDEGEQQGTLPTEEAVVSAEDSNAVSIVEADGSEEEEDKVAEEDAINVSHTQMEDVEMLEDTKEVEDKDTGDDDSDDDVNDDDDVSDDNGVKDETEGIEEMVQEDERQVSEADELQKEEPESEGREDDTKPLEDKDDDNDDVVDRTEAVEEMAEQDEDEEDNQTAEAQNLQEEEIDLTGRKNNMNSGIVESPKEEESQDDKNTGEDEVQEELEVEKRDDGLNQNIETEAHDARKMASDEATVVVEIAEEDGEKLEEITKMEITNEMYAEKNDETGEKGTPKEEAVATEADTKDEGKAKTNDEAEEEESQPKATSKKVRLRRSSRRKR